MIRSKFVSICNRSRARRVNNGKLTISYGVPLFDALVRGESLHPRRHGILLHNLETLVYDAVKTRSVYFTWTWIGTRTCHVARKNVN